MEYRNLTRSAFTSNYLINKAIVDNFIIYVLYNWVIKNKSKNLLITEQEKL